MKKIRTEKHPINRIKISGTEILNIDLNQGWEIINLEYDDTCPPNWIDSLVVTFEKRKRGENKMNETNENISTTGTTPKIDQITSETINPPKMIGWICPVCGRGLSPFTNVCPCEGWIEGKWEITC